MTNYPQIGTVSHATMRNQDLIPAFLKCLVTNKGYGCFSQDLREIHTRIKEMTDTELDTYCDTEEATWDLEALHDALNDIAPPYCYFGGHPGDGSDYGFWPAYDANSDFDDDDLLQVDTLPSYILQVSDHGNMELYKVTCESVWSIA